MSQEDTLLLEAFREQEKIKISIQSATGLQARTLHHYESKEIHWDHLFRSCAEVFQVMGAYNRDGRLAHRSLADLQRLGRILLDELFPPNTKEQLLTSPSRDLVIRIDNGLVQIPWELLYDGERFFCLRWNMGRLVRTPQKLYRMTSRELRPPFGMIIIADPRGDLPAGYQEGQIIRDRLDEEPIKIEAELLSQRVTTRMVKERLKECDILHYAGHADYVNEEPAQSGLLVQGGKLTAAEIMAMSGGEKVPSLVFVNACLSGQTSEWTLRKGGGSQEIFGLANAFLLAGARHYVGTFWDIQDELSSRFAMHFYDHLLRGDPVGACLRTARERIIRDVDETAIVWATYLLYGDPSFAYIKELSEDEITEVEAASAIRSPGPRLEGKRLRVRGESSDAPAPEDGPHHRGSIQKDSSKKWPVSLPALGFTFLFILFLGGAVWIYHQGKKVNETTALLQRTAEDLYVRGDFRDLLDHYQKVLNSGTATQEQLADLHGRLGRVYARMGELDKSVDHYKSALARDPEDRVVKGNLCVALNRMGQYKEADQCLQGLLKMEPHDIIALTLHRSLEERLAAQDDRARKAHTDSLVERLSKRAETGNLRETPTEDAWVSRPLTLALLRLEDHGGLSVRDGESEALLQSILYPLQEAPRVAVVDRYLLEEILEELDLGSGKLADPAFSLHLGKILAARLMGHGSIHRDKDNLQVNLRFVETETSSLKVALSHTFPKDTPVDVMGNKLAEVVLQKIRDCYPLKGTVLSTHESGTAVVNLGKKAGLKEKTVMKVLPPQGTDSRLAFARLRIVSVEKETSEAELLEHTGPVVTGCRVLETVEIRE